MAPFEASSRVRVRPAVMILWILLTPLALGFLGATWWAFDILANFRPLLGAVLAVVGLAWWWFDRSAAQGMLFAAAVGLASLIPLYLGAGPVPTGDTIEIVSFNVGISNPQRDAVAAFIAEESPDLVFLFESSFEWEDAMRRDGVPLTLISIVPRGRLAGVTILAAGDIDPRAIDVDVSGEAAAVTVTAGGVEIDVIGVHPPSPTTADRAHRRDEMLAATGEWVASRDNPVVLVGDFNATPWSASFRRLQRRGLLHDTLWGAGLQASWPEGWGPLAIPIDHVLHTADLGSADRRTGPSFGSAHRPVLVSVGPTG